MFLITFSVNSHDILWEWKRYSTPQFFKLVIFSIYPSSIGINWKSNQEDLLRTPDCHTFTFQKEWTTLCSHRECDLQKSHFWPPVLHSLNEKAVRSCGMWERAILVLGPCVSWVCARDCQFSHRVPSEKCRTTLYSLLDSWYTYLQKTYLYGVTVYILAWTSRKAIFSALGP